MEDQPTPPPPTHDVNFEVRPGDYEIWFSDRIADHHAELVDQFADWLDDDVGALNLGQIEHRRVLADGVLGDELRLEIVAWWAARLDDLDLG